MSLFHKTTQRFCFLVGVEPPVLVPPPLRQVNVVNEDILTESFHYFSSAKQQCSRGRRRPAFFAKFSDEQREQKRRAGLDDSQPSSSGEEVR